MTSDRSLISSALWMSLAIHSLALAGGACSAIRYDWTVKEWVYTGSTNLVLASSSEDQTWFRAGAFYESTDFDPREDGVDIREPKGEWDVFASKFTSYGDPLWTYTAGGTGYERIGNLFVDSLGRVYITGGFEGTVDFNPGTDVDEHLTPGITCTFITQLNPDGTYGWTRSFEGPAYNLPNGFVVGDDGDLIVAGYFSGLLDFDPGPGVDQHYSIGTWDSYVVRLDSKGNHRWTTTIGTPFDDFGGILYAGRNGSVLMVGHGPSQAKEDDLPGPESGHTAMIPPSVTYVQQIQIDGSLGWRREYDISYSAKSASTSDRGVLFSSSFYYPDFVDLDPTEGVVSIAAPASFVTKLDADGNYAWSYVLPGESVFPYSSPYNMAVLPNGTIMITGTFYGTRDFDPTETNDEVTCPKGMNCFFFLELNSQGVYQSVNVLKFPYLYPSNLFVIPTRTELFHRRVIDETVDVDPTCEQHWHLFEPKYEGDYAYVISKLHCVENPADFDDDGDVDLTEVARLQRCYRGPAARSCPTDCGVCDLDLSQVLDLADYRMLQSMLTGPVNP